MPDVFLASGAMIAVSLEDIEYVESLKWRAWRGVRGGVVAVVDKMAKGRSYRLFLHKEIAMRIDPNLIPAFERTMVKPRNGDYLDVRRENLEISVRPAKRGGQPRPAGSRSPQFVGRYITRTQPPAWSRAGHGQQAAGNSASRSVGPERALVPEDS